MSVIDINTFGGLLPSIKARDLPAEAAQVAINLDQRQPDLRPTLAVGSSITSVTSGSLSVYRTAVGGTWLSSTNVVDYAANPVQDITNERVFLTGRTTYPEAWQGGDYRPLGVPQPTVAPTAVRVAVDEYTYAEDTEARTALPAAIFDAVEAATSSTLLGSGGISGAAPTTTTSGWLANGAVAGLPSTADAQINYLFPLVLQEGAYVPKYPEKHSELMDPEFGGKQVSYGGNPYMAIPFTVRGRGFQVNTSALTTSLAAIKSPVDGTSQLIPNAQCSEYATYFTNLYATWQEPAQTYLNSLNSARASLQQSLDRLELLGVEQIAKTINWFTTSTDVLYAINLLKGTSALGTSCLTNNSAAGTLTQYIAQAMYAAGAAEPNNTSVESDGSKAATAQEYFHRTSDGENIGGTTYYGDGPTAYHIRADIDSWITFDGRGYKVFNREAMALKIRNQFKLITDSRPTTHRFPSSFADQVVAGALSLVDAVFKDSYWEALPAFPSAATKSVAAILSASQESKRYSDYLTITYDTLRASIEADSARLFTVHVQPLLPYPEDIIEDTRSYIYTYVTDWDWESAPSPPSPVLTVDNSDTVTLTFTAPPTGRNVNRIRIYRANSSNSGAAFQFVAEVASTTLTYSDAVAKDDLQEVCPTLLWIEPVATLKGLKAMPNGVFIGFDGNQIHLSEPFIPYAWPKEYRLSTEHKVVGTAILGQTAVVLTEGFPYYVSGADSATMTAQKIESPQACVSKRSIAVADGAVMYASPDGICAATPGGVRVITQGAINRRDWQAFLGATNVWTNAFAAYHEGIYYIINAAGQGYALDVASTKISTFTYSTTTLYSDMNTDKLYAVSGTSLLELFGGAAYNVATWKSRPFVISDFASMACVRVESDFKSANGLDGAVVTITYIGDGVVRHKIELSPIYAKHTLFSNGVEGATITLTITDPRMPQRLPSGQYREIEVQVEARCAVTRLTMASSMQELAGV